MDGDQRAWPPRSRRAEEPEELDWDAGEEEPPWNPRAHRAARRGLEPEDGPRPSWETLPPSARLYGAPADPGFRPVRRVPWRRWAGAVLAMAVATALVAGLVVTGVRLATPEPEPGELSDSLAGVRLTLPAGWQEGRVPPVTGFTSVARDGGGSIVMARPMHEPVPDLGKAVKAAATRYGRLLLKGDQVSVVEDQPVAQGHTRALRASYDDIVNRPAYLRVTILTRNGRTAMLVGLLQPEQAASRQALDAVLSSVR
ncbi:hypothetical protein LDL08_04875 [Nonomuraea glycinis]|jgi:hypothetical protein|uniref:Uncharacterized protein n=1 Tax=Nonomuraea glycinis TaxID=2047744 RepID=A0A918E4R1_9ACTN|nr:hypothetical protein [Nonomuraea glycinis]MCA2175512.1 hypothetical protein [Nonomuraea glycinis]WSG72186.1 hypothetical protein OHA68_22790 [Nonomuraea glycinis]GGP04824.1 hypothetical protein GCM10012278_21780 [Nonomuraea glycinis]